MNRDLQKFMSGKPTCRDLALALNKLPKKSL
jgi:hypothetical protein